MFIWQRNKNRNRNLQGKSWWLIHKTLLLYSSKWAIICCFFIYFLTNINAKSYIWFFRNMEWYLLRLEVWRKVTQRHEEHRGFIKQKSLGTEARRAQRFYIAEIVRHRGTVGACRNRGYLRVLLMFWSTSLQSSGLQGFLKRLLPKLSATRTLRLCRSLCLRHLREIALPPSPPWLCVPIT